MSWNLIGHEWATQMLQRDLAQDRLRHAYLFTGPAGVGKRTLASEFARALLCAAPSTSASTQQTTLSVSGQASPEHSRRDAPPCDNCRNCKLVARGSHPDLLMVAPQESGKRLRSAKIKIEPIRQLVYDLSLKPVEARRRVACLLRFDAANPESANAFLKTLEEPPGSTVILLTAERADDLLPTIVSRCEVVALRPLALETVRDALITKWLVPAERADLLAHLAGGRLGWAVRMHDDESALEARAQRLDDLSALLNASRVKRFAYAEKLAREGSLDRIQDALDLWLSFWRDVMLVSARTSAPLANPDRMEDLHRLAEKISPALAGEVVNSIRETGELLEKNVNTRLALEVLLLDWPRL